MESEVEDEESQLQKHVKKVSSVRFAPDAANSIFTIGEDENIPPDAETDSEIRAEIQNILPSSTLHRRKTPYAPVKKSFSFTLPRKEGSTPGQTLSRITLQRLRPFSYPMKQRKRSYEDPDSSTRVLEISASEEESYEDISIPESEEDKLAELANIKNLHIPMAQKKLYRNAILDSMDSPQQLIKSKNKKFTDYWFACFKSSFSKLRLWDSTLKKIEGQFGTGVVSYFVFLRWLIILNFVIFLLYFFVTILPYSAFSVISQRGITTAPKDSWVTDEYLQKFPKYETVAFKKKTARIENISFNVDTDLLGNLGTLLDHYVPDEILDVSVRFDKRNYTNELRQRFSHMCSERYKNEMANGTKADVINYLQDFLQGTGWLQSTILFLGSYPDSNISYFGLTYNLPVSFLAVLIASFFLTLVLMLQFSSHGVQENVLSRKSNYLTFTNILFCSWDYCIEDQKTADIRHKTITSEFKSNLAEEHRRAEVKGWSATMKAKVYTLRAFSHILVIISLLGSFYLIYRVVNFQLEKQRQNALKDGGAYTLFIQFLSPLVITGLNIFMPIFFNNMVRFEMYDDRTQVNMALFRVVFLRLASVFVLVSSLSQQITCEPKDECRAGKTEFCRTPLCWETYVGQQLYKLVITDFLVYLCMFLAYDLPRDFIVTKCKCKVTEVIGRQVFDLPSQVLSLVYSQTLCWLGVFYSPLLSGITVLKLLVVFYLKKVLVLKHCTPAPILYKASRSNYIFMMILMISFFVVTVIHGYSLASIEPSPGCSPFRRYFVIINAIPDAINDWSPGFVSFLSFLFSGFFFIPSFILLSIVLYYYWTVVAAKRKMTKVLKAQIAIEGQDKQFLLNKLVRVARIAVAMENRESAY